MKVIQEPPRGPVSVRLAGRDEWVVIQNPTADGMFYRDEVALRFAESEWLPTRQGGVRTDQIAEWYWGLR